MEHRFRPYARVLLVNMWCNDIGREVASGKPLLKTIFQVNLKAGRCSFTPASPPLHPRFTALGCSA